MIGFKLQMLFSNYFLSKCILCVLNLLHHRDTFANRANRVNHDQAALTSAA